jgi:hypothetical protein
VSFKARREYHKCLKETCESKTGTSACDGSSCKIHPVEIPCKHRVLPLFVRNSLYGNDWNLVMMVHARLSDHVR